MRESDSNTSLRYTMRSGGNIKCGHWIRSLHLKWRSDGIHNMLEDTESQKVSQGGSISDGSWRMRIVGKKGIQDSIMCLLSKNQCRRALGVLVRVKEWRSRMAGSKAVWRLEEKPNHMASWSQAEDPGFYFIASVSQPVFCLHTSYMHSTTIPAFGWHLPYWRLISELGSGGLLGR